MSSGFDLPEGTHTVILGVGDLNGIMRGKRIPASHWDHVCKSGNALSIALLAIDMTCDVWDTPYVNFDNGYSRHACLSDDKACRRPVGAGRGRLFWPR